VSQHDERPKREEAVGCGAILKSQRPSAVFRNHSIDHRRAERLVKLVRLSKYCGGYQCLHLVFAHKAATGGRGMCAKP
jgi:hypothetical protein